MIRHTIQPVFLLHSCRSEDHAGNRESIFCWQTNIGEGRNASRGRFKLNYVGGLECIQCTFKCKIMSGLCRIGMIFGSHLRKAFGRCALTVTERQGSK